MSAKFLMKFKNLGDTRGFLFSLESCKNIPFDIKRAYYITNTNGVARGFHAHRELVQIAICLNGACTFLMDDGINRESITLDSADTGIIIDKMIWHEMHDFSQDCVLLVVANDYYNEADYIRDYQTFIKEVEIAQIKNH